MHNCSELYFIPMADVTQQLVNGQFSGDLDIQDRGLSYGHGVFETLRISANKPVLWQAHIERLLKSCQRLMIPIDTLQQQLEQDLSLLHPVDNAVLKVIVTAGVGGRGYQLPIDSTPTRILQVFAEPSYPDQPATLGIQARWCQIQLSCVPLLAGIKHLNRLEQVLARAEWSDPAIREGILCGGDGYLAEGTMSNLFLVSDERLITPDLENYGVAGIMRDHVIELARQHGISVEVAKIAPDALYNADEVFFCNSLIGIWPVRQIEQQHFTLGPITRTLQDLLLENSRSC